MQWYEILSIICDFFAIITFSVFAFHCLISINRKLPARIKVRYDDKYFRYPILYCKEHQDFFVFIPCWITNKSVPKEPITRNISLTYYQNSKKIKLTPVMPPEIKCIDSFKPFYEHYKDVLYGNEYCKLNDSNNIVIFSFLITDKKFSNYTSTAFTFSFDLYNTYKRHFKQEIVLHKGDIDFSL